MQGRQGADRMVDLERQGRVDLVDIPDAIAHQHRHVRAFTGPCHQRFEWGAPGFLDRYDVGERMLAAGRPRHLVGRLVTATGILKGVAASDQRLHQVRRVRLVHAKRLGDIGQPGGLAPGGDIVEGFEAT